MSRRVTILTILVVLLGLVSTQTAHAEEVEKETKFECSVDTGITSRYLLNYAGIPLTKGPALVNEAECAHTSGIYASGLVLVPTKKFNDGKEVDIRVGYRPEVFGIEFDGSAAVYASTDGGKDYYTLNMRLEVAHTLSLGAGAKLKLYGVGDYQHPLGPGDDSLGLAAGALLNVDVPVWGNPNLGLGAEVWKYAFTPDPGKGPIGSFTAELGFKIPGTSIVAGPRGHVTAGDINGSGKVRAAGGVSVSMPFNF